jgi:hypothetical protein
LLEKVKIKTDRMQHTLRKTQNNTKQAFDKQKVNVSVLTVKK